MAWYWHRLVPVLRARGHDAVAVDLPANDDAAGLQQYADVAVAAVGAAAADVVLVAQSMAGLTAPLVCDRVPVRLLVLLNAMVPVAGETGGQWWANTGQARAQREAAERAGRLHPGDPDEDEDAVFLHDVPAEVLASSPGPPTQSGTPFGEPWPLAGWPQVPTRVLAARDDRLFPPDFQRRVAMERLGIRPDEIGGGHLVALSRPVELADRLEAYLRSVPGG
jgi:pimeloyl-ACP methyl ester carboxylesterase